MLAILATHPIQYQAPAWRLLAERGRVPFEVFYLTAHGVDPSLDLGFGQSFRWDVDLLSGYPHRFPADPPPRKIGGFWQMSLPPLFRDKIRNGAYEAIVVPGWHVRACWEAAWLARRHGVRVWMRGDSNDLRREGWARRMAKRLAIGALFHQVDRFMYVGEATRRLFLAYGAEPSALTRAPHAVDNGRFAEQAREERPRRQQWRHEWKIHPGAVCVLFAGKLESTKRPFDLLAALERLRRQEPAREYHLLVAGSGHLGSRLRRSCTIAYDASGSEGRPIELPNGPRASFLGFLNQSEMPRAYVAADLLVLPSASETWGLVVNEALACGLPCVVSDACGSAEDLVAPLDQRLCYPVGDVSALAAAIQWAADHPPSQRAIAAVIARNSVTDVVDAFEHLWLELGGRKSPGPKNQSPPPVERR